MKESYLFRQATAPEVRDVFDLIMGRVAWMDTVGIRQWNATKYDERYPLAYYEQRRQMEELFVLEDRETGRICAVGALFHEDARWPDKVNARYLHHLASAVDARGTGTIFLEKAEEYCRAQGIAWLRLDSAVGNRVLEEYYTSRGYKDAGFCVDGLYEGVLREKKL